MARAYVDLTDSMAEAVSLLESEYDRIWDIKPGVDGEEMLWDERDELLERCLRAMDVLHGLRHQVL